MGLDGHEPPYITATSETAVEEGAVSSIELGLICLLGRFGIRLEEIVIQRRDDPGILFELPHGVYGARMSDKRRCWCERTYSHWQRQSGALCMRSAGSRAVSVAR